MRILDTSKEVWPREAVKLGGAPGQAYYPENRRDVCVVQSKPNYLVWATPRGLERRDLHYGTLLDIRSEKRDIVIEIMYQISRVRNKLERADYRINKSELGLQ